MYIEVDLRGNKMNKLTKFKELLYKTIYVYYTYSILVICLIWLTVLLVI